MKRIRIAIDGPAGAGKSSVSKMVAEKLGYSYVDTGAIYRSLACLMVKSGVTVEQEADIVALLQSISITFSMHDGINRVSLNGEDVTSQIRTEQISMLASKVSALSFVRKALFAMQRQFALQGGVVMEGRDIGTVIMPDAELKIFLIASPENRAQRRLLELQARGETKPLQELADEIRKRDEQDASRETAPLKQADDAVLLDNSMINLEQTADEIVRLAKKIIQEG